jgi:DNA (cytosine-5)-methyltransferase 1
VNDYSLTSVELFSGAGGLALGMNGAGFRHLVVIEENSHACRTLSDNTAWPIACEDVSKFDFARINEDVDLVAGGPPCQPFSVAGKHLAHFDTRDMFPEAIRSVRLLRPKAFIFENVRGLSLNNSRHCRNRLGGLRANPISRCTAQRLGP